LTKDGKPPVGPGFLRLALAGGVLGVGPLLGGDDVLGMLALSDGCVCTRPCVARGLVKCEFHHEADVDWSAVALFESARKTKEKKRQNWISKTWFFA
jgi:hypothetical protein